MRLADLVWEFDAELRDGQDPQVESYVAQLDDPARRLPLLLELIRCELGYRQGQPGILEAYLGRFAELRAARDQVVALIFHEYQERTQCGRVKPTQEEYLRRFPAYAQAILRRWQQSADDRERTTTVLNGPAETATQPPAFSAPVALPGYEILDELGRGGMGVVYRAVQRALKRTVALKMILAGAHAGPEQEARFRAETEAVARLQHANIVQIYEVGQHQGQPFCALEYVAGGSLDKKLAGQPQPARLAARLTETLARAIDVAHRCGIIHRDLKPANVLLAGGPGQALEQCTPKISDFGLSKQMDDEAWKTRSGAILGTPSYMAPEQAGGRVRQIGPGTDVYALGAILYELLTGRPPFRAATAIDTLDQVRHQDPVAPSRLEPRVPRDLETVCLKCLEKEVRKRYGSAADLADDLGRFLAHEPIRARPTLAWERVVKWARRRPAVAGLLAAVSVCLLAITSSFVFRAQYQKQLLEQQLAEERRAQDARSEINGLIQEGQAANASKEWRDWEKARGLFERAQGKIRAEAAPAGLGAEAERGLAEAKGKLAAHERLEKFLQLREEALAQYAALSTGDASPGSRAVTRAMARMALKNMGISALSAAPPALDGYFSGGDREEIAGGCYQLLVILAELEPGPEPALRTLEWGLAALGLLGPPPRVYHERLARYRDALGNHAGARRAREAAALCQPTALDDYLQGVERYRDNDLGGAISALETALGRQPDHLWARYFRSVCYLRAGSPGLAKDGLTVCLSQRKDFIGIYLMRAYAQGQLREFTAAEADFAAALRLNPSPDERYALYNNRAIIRIAQQRFAEGIADLQTAIATEPDRPDAYVTLANVHKEAAAVENRAGQRLDAVMPGPGRGLVLALLSRRHELALDEATAAFNEAVIRGERLARSGELEKTALARYYTNRALLHRERQDRAAALADFEHAIRLGAAGHSLALARNYDSKGQLLHDAGRYTEAVSAFDAAVQAWPQYPEPYRLRAETLLKRGQPADLQRAITSCDEYLRHGGTPLAAVFSVRGLAHLKLLGAETSHQAAAVNDFTQALLLDPDNGALYQQRGYAYLAGSAYGPAGEDFNEAIRRQPQSAESYLGRGYAWVKLGQSEGAVADAEEAVRRARKDDPELLQRAARIYAQAVANVVSRRDGFALASLRRYQERALDLLRLALAALPRNKRAAFWRESIETDAALRPIRHSTEYEHLAECYPKAGHGQDEPK